MKFVDLNIWSISTLDTVEFEENNRILQHCQGANS